MCLLNILLENCRSKNNTPPPHAVRRERRLVNVYVQAVCTAAC